MFLSTVAPLLMMHAKSNCFQKTYLAGETATPYIVHAYLHFEGDIFCERRTFQMCISRIIPLLKNILPNIQSLADQLAVSNIVIADHQTPFKLSNAQYCNAICYRLILHLFSILQIVSFWGKGRHFHDNGLQ